MAPVQLCSVTRDAHRLEIPEILSTATRYSHPVVDFPRTPGPVLIGRQAVVPSSELLSAARAVPTTVVEDFVKTVFGVW